MTRSFPLTLPALILTAACGIEASTSPDEDEEVPASASFLATVHEVSVPSSAVVGEPFVVVVTTSGPDTCHEFDRTEVTIGQDWAEILPYDRRPTGRAACGFAVVHIEHEALLAFPEPGPVHIRIRGHDEDREGDDVRDFTVEVVEAEEAGS